MPMFVIKCSHCEKPVVVEDKKSVLPCPYCGQEIDVIKQRDLLVKNEIDEIVSNSESLIKKGEFDKAIDCLAEAVATKGAKARFLALILKCNLLRSNFFRFEEYAIEKNVQSLMGAADYGGFQAEGLSTLQNECVDILNAFLNNSKQHLDRYKSFVGERYDAISRFMFVGKCSLHLAKMGTKTIQLAKETFDCISEVCSGVKGDVSNMPTNLFEDVDSLCEELSETFRFVAKIQLHSNAIKSTSVSKGLTCPICGFELPKQSGADYLTCPSCRHRVSKEKALAILGCPDPVSVQESVRHSLDNDDLRGAENAIAFLRKDDPRNGDYAIAELVVKRNAITPLNLVVGDFIDLLQLASCGDPTLYKKQIKATASHFEEINRILNDAKDYPGGPSSELLLTLSRFIAELKAQ